MSYLLFKNISVDKANAISGPLTLGIPGITAFLGFFHKLERVFNDTGVNLKFEGVAIIINDFAFNAIEKNYNYEPIKSRHPLKKDGKSSSLLGEATIDLNISFLVKVEDPIGDYSWSNKDNIKKLIFSKVNRLAGGTILGIKDILHFESMEDNTILIKRKLMPGYALINRKELLLNIEEGKDTLDVLLEHLFIKKEKKGWLIPIVTGFQSISKTIKVDQQRDYDYDHKFVEAITTLGECKFINSIDNLNEIFWKYNVDINIENGVTLYECVQY